MVVRKKETQKSVSANRIFATVHGRCAVQQLLRYLHWRLFCLLKGYFKVQLYQTCKSFFNTNWLYALRIAYTNKKSVMLHIIKK